VRRRAARILSASGSTDREWSILLTDDDQLRQLNARFRGVDAATDVLSFPLASEDDAVPGAGPPSLLGDVVISVEQAARQDPHGDLEAEIVRLLAHGLCHLLGFAHGTAGERRAMQAEEQRLLAAVGVERGLVERGGAGG